MSADRTLSYAAEGAAEQTFPAAHLVIAFECERPLERPVRLSLGEVDAVTIGRGVDRRWSRGSNQGRPTLEVALPDGWMSSHHTDLSHDAGGWQLRDAASKNGTFVNGRPVDQATLVDGDVIEAGSTVFLFRDRQRRGARDPLDVVAGAGVQHGALATLDLELARRFAVLPRLASAGVPIILGGESGTGKEVTARAIHDLGRREGAFVALNCGALPETLVEGELFGSRRGAYSGAEDRPGLVRAADRGTLFLDEIAELPAASQVKLLRVLQEGEVLPLGATRPVPVDVRVVAASHRSLPELVTGGRFRADLYARLAGATLSLPPLRQRRADLGLLIAVLLERAQGTGAARVRFEREAARALFLHGWPLNTRELDQALRAAAALAGDGRIALAHLPEALRGRAARPGEDDHALRGELVAQLTQHGGNISAVARSMGKARVQVRRWCRRLGLDPEAFRGDPGDSAHRK